MITVHQIYKSFISEKESSFMTVFENVAYPLKMRHLPRKDIREKTFNVLEMVGLKGMENRAAPT